MKFKFCGDRDAPDWLLAEMFTISKLSSVRVRVLCGALVERVRARALSGDSTTTSTARAAKDDDGGGGGDGVDYATFRKLVDGTITAGDVEAVIAGLEYTIESAARYDVDERALGRELEQLGLPKEHADAVCKPYGKSREALREALVRGTMRVNALKDMSWGVTFASDVDDEGSLAVRLKLDTTAHGCVNVDVSEEKFRVLLGELKAVKALMDAESPA